MAFACHGARELRFDLRTTVIDLTDQQHDRMQHVERFKPRDHHRLAMIRGEGFVGGGTDHDADVCRPDEAVERHLPISEDGAHRGRSERMVDEDGEVSKPRARRFENGECGGRRGGLEPDREELNLAAGVGACESDRLGDRMTIRTLAQAAFAANRLFRRDPGTRSMSP